MADKLLKSIKFPTLPDRYVIGDTSLSEEGAAADAKATGDEITNVKSALNDLKSHDFVFVGADGNLYYHEEE